jgi:thiol-disulfide isomerase/thioredoxin
MDHPDHQTGPPRPPDRTPAGSRAWVNWAIIAAVALLLFGVFHFRPFGEPDATGHPAVGSPLLEVDLMGLTGTEQGAVTRDHLLGDVVLLHFWATWCPPCRAELPHIASLEKDLGKLEGARLLAVSSGPARSSAEWDQLAAETRLTLEDLGVDMPTYADPAGATAGAFQILIQDAGQPDLFGFPTTILVDRSGVVRAVWVGYRPGIHEEMKRMVKRLVEAQPSPA